MWRIAWRAGNSALGAACVKTRSERQLDVRFSQYRVENRNPREILGLNMNRTRKMNPIRGDSRESNSGPLAPEARIIPLDHYPDLTSVAPAG